MNDEDLNKLRDLIKLDIDLASLSRLLGFYIGGDLIFWNRSSCQKK